MAEIESKKKPNLFIKPSTGFNDGITNIETFQNIFKDQDNCYISGLQTSNNFLTKYEKENFGYEVAIPRTDLDIVKNPTSMNFDNGTFIVYDLETTGLNAKYDHITEIGAIKVTMKNGKEVKREEFQRFVKQDKPLKHFISKLTHITDDMLNKDGIPEKQAIEEFKKFCGDYPCIGHNIINFDSRFINKKCVEHKLSSSSEQYYNNAQIDTMEISRLFNNRPNHTLRSMAQDLKITYDPKYQHRAIADVIVNWEVFKQTCIPMLKDLGVNNVKDINSLKENNIIYRHQHSKTNAVLFPNAFVKNKLSKLAQERKLTFDIINKYNEKCLCTNWPSGDEIISSYINDSTDKFKEKIDKYSFITLPPISFWTDLLSNTSLIMNLDLTDPNTKLLYKNRKELKKVLKNCNTKEKAIEALAKSNIFKQLNITNSNVEQILSKVDFLINPYVDIKESKNSVELKDERESALTLEQLQDTYKNIIEICKKSNKPIIIDNEIYVADKTKLKEFIEHFSNLTKNPYKKFMKTKDGCRVIKYPVKKVENELSFLDKATVKEILYSTPQKLFKKINSFNLTREQKTK